MFVHSFICYSINFIILIISCYVRTCVLFQVAHGMGDFGKSEFVFTEGCLLCRQVSLGIFQRVYSSGTSEVVRCAFSDVHIDIPLFSAWLLAALRKKKKREGEKVVNVNKHWYSLKKLEENTYLW